MPNRASYLFGQSSDFQILRVLVGQVVYVDLFVFTRREDFGRRLDPVRSIRQIKLSNLRTQLIANVDPI